MNFSVWLAFLVASILIAITPGPGAFAAMSTGMRHGYPAALRVILGLQGAILFHLTIVGLGLGALVATSETAFDAIKFIGAAYLIWLGVQKWRAPPEFLDATPAPYGRHGLFFQGLLVNLTNPKAIVFIAALVPQFVDPAASQWPQYLIIAATACTIDVIVMSSYALAAARIGRWLSDFRAQRLQNRFFGTLFVTAGTLLAFSHR